jgi:hypothetical protein
MPPPAWISVTPGIVAVIQYVPVPPHETMSAFRPAARIALALPTSFVPTAS